MLQEQPFVDHYEVLQLSQNADAEMIERVYRLLAKRYHPDNGASGDEARFREVHDAYDVLSDREKRAEFDVEFDREKTVKWQIFDQGSSQDVKQQDQLIFHGVLSLLYAARRRNPSKGGLGPLYFEEMLGVPREHLEFPLWYLKKRGYTEILETGEVAITVNGIDSLNSSEVSLPNNRLLQATGSESSPSETDAPDMDGVARVG